MRFVQTAMENLKSIDTKIYSGLVGKLFNDCQRLYTYKIKFAKLNRNASVVYRRNFLSTLPEYVTLKVKYDVLTAQESAFKSNASTTDSKLAQLENDGKANSNQYKNVKKSNVDALHNASTTREQISVLTLKIQNIESHLFTSFEQIFNKKIENCLLELRKCINAKMMFLDKLLLKFTSESKSIQAFFKNANIEGEFDIKNFIKYYMRNIDTSKVKSSGWHTYLEECLIVLE
jgi:hypothetical protein